MIAPRGPLLFLTALLCVPAATAWFALPALATVAALFLLLFFFAIVVDALFFQPDFSGIRIVLPEIVRLSKGREGNLEIKVAADETTRLNFRVGLPLPAELGAIGNEFDVDLTKGGAQSLTITCQPQRRGRYLLQKCFVQGPTRFRLWNARRAMAVQSEVRVYPDLLSERRNLSTLFLRRGSYGFRRYRQVGKGREFEKLREYIPGDGVEDVHWKATAKRGHPVTKVFQIERTQEVYVIVDSSRLTARWWGGAQVFERFVNSALILCLAAARQSDLFGLITFNDNVRNFIRARNGKAHYDVCRDALYALQPQTVTPDFQDLFTFLRLRLRRRALLVFLTALDDPVLADAFVQHVDLLTRQHLVLVNMIQPPEARALFVGPPDDVTDVDSIYRRLGGHLQWGELQELRKRLHRCGVEFSLVSGEQFAAEAVNRYIRVKQRQLL